MRNPFIAPEGRSKPKWWQSWINIILVGTVILLFTLFAVSRLNYKFDFTVIWTYRIKYLRGFLMTLSISFFSLILSLIIAMSCALALEGRFLFTRYLARAYVEGIRGTPFLVQINFTYFIIATALGVSNKFLLAVVILSFFAGAYITEIIRGGIQSIPESQWMTAKSLGLTKMQTYRYIVLPQVIKRILPSLAGQMSSLVKDSSLLSIIAVSEFVMNGSEVEAITFRTFESLSFIAVGYLVITIPISLLSKWLERKFYYES